MGKAKITLAQAQAVVNEHREAELARKVEASRAYIGRYFRYRNTYGGDNESWWLYAMPTAVNDFGWLTGLSFQHTSLDEIRIEQKESLHVEQGGWKEVSAAEFWDAASDMREEVVRRLTRPANLRALSDDASRAPVSAVDKRAKRAPSRSTPNTRNPQ